MSLEIINVHDVIEQIKILHPYKLYFTHEFKILLSAVKSEILLIYFLKRVRYSFISYESHHALTYIFNLYFHEITEY